MPEPEAGPPSPGREERTTPAEGLRLLGFDFGLRRIGVAVGQTITQTATPLTTVTAQDGQADWQAIDEVIERWRPDLLILGKPSSPNGDRHALDRPINRFRRMLEERYGLRVELIDENLSSSEASQILKRQRQQGRRRRVNKADVDRVSAAILLERWMTGAVSE